MNKMKKIPILETHFTYKTNKYPQPVGFENEEQLKSQMLQKTVVVTERILGEEFSIHFDGNKKITIENWKGEVKNAKSFNGLGSIFNSRYLAKFILLIKEQFRNVRITLYGIHYGGMIDNTISYLDVKTSSDLIFYDLLIQGIWINWNDFETLMKKYKIPYTEPIYSGFIEDSDFVLGLRNGASLLNDRADKHGIMIRELWSFGGSKRDYTFYDKNGFIKKEDENIPF